MAKRRTKRNREAAEGALGYARVSTEDQARNGISLAAQRSRIEAYCEAHGLRLVRIEEDAGISAKKTTNRPALQRALAALRGVEDPGRVPQPSGSGWRGHAPSLSP